MSSGCSRVYAPRPRKRIGERIEGERCMGRSRTRCAAALTALAVAAGGGSAVAADDPAFRDPRFSPAERAVDLVSRMTLAEKAAQLSSSNAPAIPRLGIQDYSYWNEAQHGVYLLQANDNGTARGGATFTVAQATSFATTLSASLSWDRRLVYRAMTAVSDEVRGFLDKSLFGTGQNNLGTSRRNYGSLFHYSPTVNVLRDPRWGRADEGFGEDPYLVGTLGTAYVSALQGQTPTGRPRSRYLKAVSTVKHYALNNVERDRTGISSDTDEATVRDYYTAHFRRIVERARATGLMSAYNAVNGTPAAANRFLLNDLARRTWGFTGYISSDCGAVATTYRRQDRAAGAPGG